jgi:hypothetical protein
MLVIVFAAAHWGFELSQGWQHEVVGYCLFLIGVFLLLSTDQLLAGLLAPVLDWRRTVELPEFDPESDPIPPARDPLSRVWNRLVAQVPSQSVATEAPIEKPAVNTRTGFGLAGVFGVLGLLQCLSIYLPDKVEIRSEEMADAFRANWLPERTGRWHRVRYKAEERERASDLGQFSHQWVYQSDNHLMRVSVDFPFFGWQDAARCYRARGWIEAHRTVHRGQGEPFVGVQFEKPTGEAAYLLFSLFDGAGQPVELRSTQGAGLRDRLAASPLVAFFRFRQDAAPPGQIAHRIQQFVTSSYVLDKAQRWEVEQLYLGFRRHLVSKLQTKD